LKVQEENEMPKGYWVACVEVTDPAAYQKYREALAVPFNKFGGKFLTRGGKSEMAEGKLRSRVVVIEFPTYDAAVACYRSNEYQAAKAIRQSASSADLVLLEGYDGPQF
jgi:uncharacterized protein (DUF1330 family)